MKSSKFLLLIVMVFSIISCNTTNSDNTAENTSTEQGREYYQFKTYTLDTDEQELTTDNYLKEAFLPGLKKLGINNVGVFKPRPGTDSLKKIYVLIPFSTLEQFNSLEGKLAKDEAYLTAGSEYINASYDQPPYQRIESTLMIAFEDMPFMETPKLDDPREDRVYELRSYESATENYHKTKVDMFNAGGEVKLFASLDFNAVFYASVISGSKMPNLMYMTTFSDEASQSAHWTAFREAPEWLELKAVEKYKNSVSHIDKYYLYPTEYSDY
ncbi:MAG: NIPSNAP family protein [Bacteroidales bacterium]|nr:NIPSNAP family protein [Bacteroidales bacterium]